MLIKANAFNQHPKTDENSPFSSLLGFGGPRARHGSVRLCARLFSGKSSLVR